MKRIFDCTVVLAALFLFGLPMLLVALLILSLPNAFFQLPITGLGKRIFLMDGFFTLAFISGLRISKKLYLEVIPI